MNHSYQLQSAVSVKMTHQAVHRQRTNCDELSVFAATRSRWSQGSVILCGLMVFLWGSLAASAQTSMSEYQLKALFLCNFVKYVDWPSGAMQGTGPIVIGILGEDNFSDNLKRAVEGKTVNGRQITIKHLSAGEELSGCSILFVSSSENSRLGAILGKTSTLPILTVGEDASFLQKGGIINFVLKEGKIQLEVNLQLAQKVKLQISSKLLSVAVVVKE